MRNALWQLKRIATSRTISSEENQHEVSAFKKACLRDYKDDPARLSRFVLHIYYLPLMTRWRTSRYHWWAHALLPEGAAAGRL